MAPKFKYRLQMILDEKESRKKEAEKMVAEAKLKIQEEEKKYKELLDEKRKLIEKIKNEKLKRINSKEAFRVENSIRLKEYIEGLESKRQLLDGKIFAQKGKVEEAKRYLKLQEENLISATKEYETFKKHKEKFLEKMRREEEKKEQKIMEEIGTLQFLKNFRENKKDEY